MVSRVSRNSVKKRRSGRKTKGSLPKNKNLLVLRRIKNERIKSLYDKSKTPVENFKELGLSFDPNNFKGRKCYGENNERSVTNKVEREPEAKIAFLGLTSLPVDKNSLHDSNPKRKKMSEFDQNYIKQCINKYGDDFKGMEKDMKLNYFQYSEKKLKTLIEKFKSLSDKDRVIVV